MDYEYRVTYPISYNVSLNTIIEYRTYRYQTGSPVKMKPIEKILEKTHLYTSFIISA